MGFKSLIKSYGLNPWRFIYPKPNSHWQYQNPIHIGNIKAQFLLAISKLNSYRHYLSKAQFSLAILKTQFSLAIFKAQFSLATSKSQFSLAISKAQFSLVTSKSLVLTGNIKTPNFQWQHQKAQFSLVISKTQFTFALFYQKHKIIDAWQKYHVIIISFKR